MENVNKISTKKIGVQPSRKELPNLGETRNLATLIGIASGYKTASNEAGTFLKFAGDFEAKRISDGVVFAANKAIFPQPFASELKMACDKNKDGSGVQFAALLSIKGDDNVLGYVWQVDPIGSLSGTADPLAALRAEAEAEIKGGKKNKK